MYYAYYGFASPPFSIAPDPRYLFLSQKHNEAIAHLTYGLQNQTGGFVLLTGEIGAGKTTVCRVVLESLPADCDVALVYNPRLNIVEMLATICDELHIRYPRGTNSVKPFVERLNTRLLESHADGRKTVLIIDEAQNLDDDVLEQLRLLTNLETSERKLLQIILLGQPELATRLAQPNMTQLAQRIIARYHLKNLTASDVASYIHHRLTVAGGPHHLFPESVVTRIFKRTRGNPRLINVVCDRALLGAYVQGLDAVDIDTVERAMAEVLGHKPSWPGCPAWLDRWLGDAGTVAIGLALLLLVSMAGAFAYFHHAGPADGNSYTVFRWAEPPASAQPVSEAAAGDLQLSRNGR